MGTPGDLFSAFFGQGHNHPASENPKDYPRSCEITDSQCLDAIVTIQAKSDAERDLLERLRDLQDQITIVRSEKNIIATKVFQRLRELYPDVYARGPVGWRKYDEKYWFVGWHDAT